jgi:hypothetical protein
MDEEYLAASIARKILWSFRAFVNFDSSVLVQRVKYILFHVDFSCRDTAQIFSKMRSRNGWGIAVTL